MFPSALFIVAGIGSALFGIFGNSFNLGDIFPAIPSDTPVPRWFGKIALIFIGIILIALGIHLWMTNRQSTSTY